MSELPASVDTVTDWTYSYDSLGRLSTGLSTNTGQGCQFTYDSFGNRMSEAPYQSGSCNADYLTFAASATNQADTFCYDAAGNLLSPGACASGGSKNAYLYDAYGTLLVGNYNQSPYTSYSVDEYERRVAKWQSGAIDRQYLYGADGNPVAEADGAGNWLQTNVRAGGMFLAELQPSGITYLHTDHLGTIRAESNSSGTRTMTCSNLPFGDALNCNGNTGPSGYHFTGKERDQESGNDYFGARYNDSSMGRFLSPDPQGNSYADFSNPQSWNMYAYVMNNPIGFTDPTGMYCYYGDTDFTSEQGQKDQLDPTQWDYHSNSKECTTNGGQWYDDAYTHGGFDDAGRPDYAVSANTQASNSPQPSAWQAAYDFQVSSSSGLRDDELNFAMTKLLPSQFDGRPISFSTEDPYRFFGTHYCGPGGSGSTVGALDPACKVHDACYEAAPGGGISAANNYNPSQPMTTAQAAQAKQCNQALYDAARSHPDVPGSKAVQWWMVNGSHFPGNGLYILFPGTEAVPW